MPQWLELGARYLGEVVENKPASSFVVSLVKSLNDAPAFMWKTGGPGTSDKATPKRVRTSHPNYKICFLVNGE